MYYASSRFETYHSRVKKVWMVLNTENPDYIFIADNKSHAERMAKKKNAKLIVKNS